MGGGGGVGGVDNMEAALGGGEGQMGDVFGHNMPTVITGKPLSPFWKLETWGIK